MELIAVKMLLTVHIFQYHSIYKCTLHMSEKSERIFLKKNEIMREKSSGKETEATIEKW